MNLHKSGMPRSRYSIEIFVLLLAALAAVLFTARWQSSVKAGGGIGSDIQMPPGLSRPAGRDIEKDFNDDDLKVKEKKPRGKWGTAIESDMNQFNDASVPVAIGAIQSLSGGGKYAGVVKIKRVEIKNRSSKAVNSVQLRWQVTGVDDPAKVLSVGATPFVNTRIERDSSLVVELPTLYPALMLKPLEKDGELSGRFLITISVQEARFADGSSWRPQESVGWLDTLYLFWFPANRLPYLASTLRGVPLPIDPGDSRVVITPCEAEPRSSASAFSFTPFQTTTCHDDTTT